MADYTRFIVTDGQTYTPSTGTTYTNPAIHSGDGGAGEVEKNGFLSAFAVSFSGNSASYSGGAISNYYGTVAISASIFSENSASYSGGAIYNSGTATIKDSTFIGNSAGNQGGSIYNVRNATISDSTFTGNSAGSQGGSIYNVRNATISDSTFSNSNAKYGGAIHNFCGTATIRNAIFIGNSAFYGGGAIFDDKASANISDSTFSGNSTSYYGGAIYNGFDSSAIANISNSIFSSNIANYKGGAICNEFCGTAGISGSTFTGNSASYYGGAFYNGWMSAATISTSTFSGNSATYGGAVYNSNTATIENSIFNGNAASTGGAIYNSGTMNLNNIRFMTKKDTVYTRGTMNLSGDVSIVGNFYAGGTVTSNQANIVLNLQSYAPSNETELVTNFSNIGGTTNWIISVKANQTVGTYLLATGVSGFTQSMTVKSEDGVQLGTISIASSLHYAATSMNYTLKCEESVLSLILAYDASLYENDKTPPATPDNIQSSLRDNYLTISWGEVTDMTGVAYEVEYSKDSTFQNDVGTESLAETNCSFKLKNGTWYWRIRSKDGAGNYSSWSNTSSVEVNYAKVIEGRFTNVQDCDSNVIIRETANGECGYPAAVRIMADDCTVTVEGGTLACSSIRNACILFGEDATWVSTYGYGPHYNGTVTFTAAQTSFDSKVSNCVTAAGIVGNNLTVNFTGNADKSAGISFHAGAGSGPGYYAYAITADESLTINGTFGGTAISFFDFSQFSSQHWCSAYGFDAGGNLTVNGGISGTVLAYAYASTNTSQYAYGISSAYNKNLTITGEISGTVAAFGLSSTYALYGGCITATITGTLIAGKSQANQDEASVLALISDTDKNKDTLTSLCADNYAIYDYGYGTSTISVKSGARIFGKIDATAGNAVITVSSNALITGNVSTDNLVITLEGISESYVLQQGWSSSSTTINADSAQNGTYKLADYVTSNKTITIVCGNESKTWSGGTTATYTFQGGKQITIGTADNHLTLTASGFEESTDKIAPDISAVTVNTTVDKNSVTVSWNAASDNVGVTQYRIRYALSDDADSAVQVVVSADQTQTLLTSLQNGQYTLELQAGDAAGNWSAWTSAKSFTIDVKSEIVTLPYEMPQAEYMYGCVPTSIGMLLGYYDLYGYKGRSLANIIPGTISIKSRGTDGNAYDMDAFDTVLGNFIASQEYVSRFYGKTESEELPYTYVNGNPAQGLNTSVFNSLADWIGTGQYWRGNGDLSTSHYFTDLDWLNTTKQTSQIGSLNISAKYTDYKWGLSQYLQSVGYQLDAKKTKTVYTDQADGTFTFEDYMAEIDAGRPVLISIRTAEGEGHTMVGYGYDATLREIIFDDTYESGKKMAWNGSYSYADDTFYLSSITTIVFDESSLGDAHFEDGVSDMNITGNVYTSGEDVKFENDVISGTVYAGEATDTPEDKNVIISGTTATRAIVGGNFNGVDQENANQSCGVVTAVVTGGTFAKGILAGEAKNSTIYANTTITVSDSNTGNVTFGGMNITAGTADAANYVTINGDSMLTLTDVTNTLYTNGGSLITHYGKEVRNGDITVNIDGGSFAYVSGGSLIQSSKGVTEHMISSEITGDITMTISGTAVIDSVYAGSGALKASASACANVTGDIAITIDVTEDVTIKNYIFAGGMAKSTVNGDATITIKGAGDGTDYLGAKILSGESSHVKGSALYVSGEKSLVFDNFSGKVTSRVAYFDTITLDATSQVEFTAANSYLDEGLNWNISADKASNVSVNLTCTGTEFYQYFSFADSELNFNCTDIDNAGTEWTIFQIENDSIEEHTIQSFDSMTAIINGDVLSETDPDEDSVAAFEGNIYRLEYRIGEDNIGKLVAFKLESESENDKLELANLA